MLIIFVFCIKQYKSGINLFHNRKIFIELQLYLCCFILFNNNNIPKNAVGFYIPPIIEFYQTPKLSPW